MMHECNGLNALGMGIPSETHCPEPLANPSYCRAGSTPGYRCRISPILASIPENPVKKGTLQLQDCIMTAMPISRSAACQTREKAT